MSKVQAIFLDGPAGRIEGILKFRNIPEPGALAVVCHPYSFYQGTMYNKVVYAVANALFDCGYNVLRFNFRGVGLSTSSHDKGRGEIEDTLSAVHFVGSRWPSIPCLAAGFSFGAWMALEAVRQDSTLISVIAVAPPLKYFNPSPLTKLSTPKLFLQGSAAEICDPQAVGEIYPSIAQPKDLVLFERAGHFFEGRLVELKAAIADRRSFLGIP